VPTCAIAEQQLDGSYLLKLAPAVTDVTTCSYVVQSGADIANSLFTMSAEDGGLISAGIVSVWSAAWGIKAILQIVKGSSENEKA
jgi:hypothetical protein